MIIRVDFIIVLKKCRIMKKQIREENSDMMRPVFPSDQSCLLKLDMQGTTVEKFGS